MTHAEKGAVQSTVKSAIYRGRVRHRRLEPTPHAFDYDLHMLYLDLDELPQAFDGRWLWSVGRSNLASFRREDYLGPRDQPLKQAVLARVAAVTGRAPDGPVRMLTHLRYFGFCFNPVTFYYCFDREEQLESIVAEITNTPWGERHAYVLTREDDQAATGAPDGKGTRHLWCFPKEFHVSPFMDMDQDYRWRFEDPGERLFVHMENLRDEQLLFDATLTLERHPLDGPSLARCLVAHPCMTGKAVAGIYWQALRLWLKRIPFHNHPAKLTR